MSHCNMITFINATSTNPVRVPEHPTTQVCLKNGSSSFRHQMLKKRRVLSPPCSLQSDGDSTFDPDADKISSEFAKFINEREASSSSSTHPSLVVHRTPSHLLTPTSAISSILSALMRNDWPEADAGIEDTAFSFSKPWREENLPAQSTPLAVGLSSRKVRSWGATEAWLDRDSFREHLHAPPYDVLLESSSFEISSPLLFPSRRTDAKAVQVVAVQSRGRVYNFSFCMEREESGSMKGCWLVAGVRQGDYST